MKLSELKIIIDEQLAAGDDLDVCVQTADGGLSGTNVNPVTGCYAGFDWYSGRFLICTRDNLIKKP